MDVVAISKAEPSALPWQDAPLSCKDTIKLVREAVFAVLVVALRLDRKDALSAATSPSTVANAPATGYDTAKVEMSIYMMRFFKRSRWDAEDA
eukprot:gene8264-17749_t